MDKKELKESLIKYSISCNDAQIELLEKYMEFVLKANENINLTAINNTSDFREKMILDSALPLRLLDFNNKNILDVGSGAGFPGVVISILSNANVSLLDSTRKKLDVISSCDFIKVNTINARAEDYVKSKREFYDVVVARAVAPLNILVELCLPFVKVGGVFIAMKGSDYRNEIKECDKAIYKLGAELINVDTITLPSGEERANIVFVKKNPTNKKYPRQYNEIKERPLR